jgi:hypothetical protein
MDSEINLLFRYDEIDYVRAVRAHYSHHLQVRLDIILAIVLAAGGIYLLQTSRHTLGFACLGGAILLGLLMFAAFFVIPPLNFRREPKFREDYSLTFSQDGIHFQTEHIDSELQWSLYSKALIDRNSYLLYYGTRQFTIIPKKAFHGIDEQFRFEQMLAQHIPKIIRRSE